MKISLTSLSQVDVVVIEVDRLEGGGIQRPHPDGRVSHIVPVHGWGDVYHRACFTRRGVSDLENVIII